MTLRQRDWVEAVGYIGPDRRRFNSGDYSGPPKRRSDAQVTLTRTPAQALKILRSSIAAVDLDPEQAMRSMLVQASDLQKAGMAVADLKLTTAAIDFGRYLNETEAQARPTTRRSCNSGPHLYWPTCPRTTTPADEHGGGLPAGAGRQADALGEFFVAINIGALPGTPISAA